ncbi:MAG: hypothetical protein AAGF83_15965 [Cyanobacteria bacterium P01_G01_bin.67]
MKYQLLGLSILGTVLSFQLFSDRPSYGEPETIFQPIIQEIRDRLPKNYQLRLPAALPKFTEELELYAFIPDDDLQLIGVGEKEVFTIAVASLPNCAEQEDPTNCIVGIVGVTEAISDSALEMEDLPPNSENVIPINLAQDVSGFYLEQGTEMQLVVWEQDRLGHLLVVKKCEDNCVSQEELIEMAISAARKPAITKEPSISQ